MTPLIFIGAGPFSEQVEIVRDINAVSPTYQILGILDDDADLVGENIEGFRVLGDVASASTYSDVKFVLGVGTNTSRTLLAELISRLALPLELYETLIHPGAKIYSSAKIGFGSIIHAGCIIGNGTHIEPLCKIIWNSVVGADNLVGQGTSICPNSTTCSGVKIGPYSFLASAVAVADDITIGPMAKIGLGSTIVREVPAGAFVLGNPVKMLNEIGVPDEILTDWHESIARYG